MFGKLRTKLATGAQRVLGASVARRLIHQQDGAAAVEFALVAAPFLALVFGRKTPDTTKPSSSKQYAARSTGCSTATVACTST